MKQNTKNTKENNLDEIITQLEETLSRSFQKADGIDPSRHLIKTDIRHNKPLNFLIEEYEKSTDPEIPKILARISSMLNTEILDKLAAYFKEHDSLIHIDIIKALNCEVDIYKINKTKKEIVSELKKNHFNEEGERLSTAIDKLVNNASNPENSTTAIDRLSQAYESISSLEYTLTNLQTLLNGKLTIGKSHVNTKIVKDIVKLYEDNPQGINPYVNLTTRQNIIVGQFDNRKLEVDGLSKDQYHTAHTNFLTQANDFLGLLNSNNVRPPIKESFKNSLSNLLKSLNNRDETYTKKDKDIIERMYDLNAEYLKKATEKVAASIETITSLDPKSMGSTEFSNIIHSQIESLVTNFNDWTNKGNKAMRFINNRQAGLLER